MTVPRLVAAGVTLRDQVDARWPDRDKASDGWLGDAAHQGRPSFHNPDAQGWVHALDLDEDLREPGAMRRLADQLAACAREGRDGGRLLHLVYEDQVCSGTPGEGHPEYWRWRGSGYGHTAHLHVTFTDAAERDGAPFPLPILNPEPPPAPDLEEPRMILLRNGISRWRLLTGDRIVGITPEFAAQLQAAGVKVAAIGTDDLNALAAALGPEV